MQCQKTPHNLLELKKKGLTEYLQSYFRNGKRQKSNREKNGEDTGKGFECQLQGISLKIGHRFEYKRI